MSEGNLYERAQARFPGGASRTTLFVDPEPPFVLRGEGCRVIDVEGRELIDLHGDYSALVHGNAFAPVVQAAQEALRAGSAFGLPTAAEVQLAERLAARMPWAPRWRFAGSGTEAVMAAVRAARVATGRDLVVRFEGCYHGAWDALAQPGAPGVPAPTRASVLTLPLGDEQALRSAIESRAGEVACVLLDLMPNRTGLRPLEQAFVRLVRELTQAHGIVLIVDEVITFRLAVAGMQSLYGFEGDVVVLGKLIGGGLPVGALGGRPGVMDVFDPRRAGGIAAAGTFSANPVSMRAGIAALDALDEPAIERINELGEHLRAELGRLGYEVSGRGSLCKLHARDMPRLWRALYEQGVLVAADGLVSLSTALDEPNLEHALAAFARVRG